MNEYKTLFFAIITALLIVLSLTSCKTTKHVTRDKTEKKTETDLKSVSTTTTTEEIKEPICVPADSISSYAPVSDLLGGKEIVEETPTMELTAEVDKKGVIHFTAKKKPQTIQAPAKKVSVTTTTTTGHQVTDEKKNVKVKDIKRESGFSFNYLWWLLLLLLLPIWKYRRYFI